MKQKHITFLIAIFSFILLNTLVAFNIYKTKFISKDIFRLHVVANSNSIEDQIIKLKAESKIKEYISNLKIRMKFYKLQITQYVKMIKTIPQVLKLEKYHMIKKIICKLKCIVVHMIVQV